ncbi:MAG: hypothetical protein ACRDPE_23475 [Solirubrobacterales bacterium]
MSSDDGTTRIGSVAIADAFVLGINTLSEIARDESVASDTRVHAAYILVSELKGKPHG